MAKRQTKLLTDAHLRAWVAASERVAKSDGDGLTFTLSAKGVAAWVLRYSFGGRQRELTLGRYPDLTLTEARKRASAARLQVAAGVDVAVAKQRDRTKRRDALTVRELVRNYERRMVPQLAHSTATGVRAYLANSLLPAFGSWAVSDVSDADVVEWLHQLRDKRSYFAASNARKAAVMVFAWGIEQRSVTANPFANVQMKVLGRVPSKRERVMLTPPQLEGFLQGMTTLEDRDSLVYRILLATGVRGGELFGAEWTDIDLERATWRIPRDKIKTRRVMECRGQSHFEIPLAPLVVGWLRALRDLSGGSRWLVPPRVIRGEADRPADYERFLDRLKVYTDGLGADFPAITFHDLRSTMRSHLTDTLNIRLEVAERAINHQLSGLGRIYDKSDYLPQRAEALERWARMLADAEAGRLVPRGKVVALKGRAAK